MGGRETEIRLDTRKYGTPVQVKGNGGEERSRCRDEKGPVKGPPEWEELTRQGSIEGRHTRMA